MKDFLQGKPVKHPLHPFLVHFPIALFVFSFVLDVASFAVEHPFLVRGAFYALALGVIAAILAAVPGVVDYNDIRQDHPAKRTATYHMLVNLVAVALYAVNMGLRYPSVNELETPALPFGLSVAGLILLSISGYLGGVMVYDHGIAVGRHRRRTDTPIRTISIRVQEGSSPVPVENEAALAEGGTLRVEVNGQVIAIAKSNGHLYAFQEFCTHRYGPLSEGALCEGRVQCPWHRSVFDLASGKVIHGPAKVDLRTFPVEVRNGTIYLFLRQTELDRRAA